MTTIADIQQYLTNQRLYTGLIDGHYGPRTQQSLKAACAAGPDTPMTPVDIANAARALGTTPAAVRTVKDVEAAGAGFQSGYPKVLFEGQVFSKATGGRFNATNPTVSYPSFDRSKYPATQDARFDQIVQAVGLDPDAGFSAASWGAFQILGENYKACGYASPFAFVMAMCQTEGAQLMAFVNFVISNHLASALASHDWATFARGYNGSAYRANNYDGKLASFYAQEAAKG
jgi:hypothetical protein